MMTKRYVAAAVAAGASLLLPKSAWAMQTIATPLSGAISADAMAQHTLLPLNGLEHVLIGLAVAASILAIILAMVRGVLFASKDATAATIARVVRILALCALMSSMMALLSYVYQMLGGGLSVAGIVAVQGGA